MTPVGIRDVRKAFGTAKIFHGVDSSVRECASGAPPAPHPTAGPKDHTEIRIDVRAMEAPPSA